MRITFIVLVTLITCINSSFSIETERVGPEMYYLRQEQPASVEITVIDNRIQVNHAPIGSKLEIYSVVGIKVKEFEIKHSSGEYVVNIAKGYYIIRIGETVRKVAIR
ncbi:MAG: T9SS type A sorting domain-containing protein [Tannerellaceae bacterium]|nr:T9SS type A sorting domain-containing protein [Tannerellaceae bacterium]